MRRLRSRLRRWLDPGRLERLERAVIEVDSLSELKKIFGWEHDPTLDDPSIHRFEYLEDVNERRLRDAESLGVTARNSDPEICLDVGTGLGHSAALMAVNAPSARVVTVNADPEEIASGRAGDHTTVALERVKIGSYYRQRELSNVTQVFANTLNWRPTLERIDLAFIDGCHDADFVVSDTRMALGRMRSGGFVLWHDFHPGLARQYDWIGSVCAGVEELLKSGAIRERIFHLRNSWTGIHRIP